jgi:hypothetical protein
MLLGVYVSGADVRRGRSRVSDASLFPLCMGLDMVGLQGFWDRSGVSRVSSRSASPGCLTRGLRSYVQIFVPQLLDRIYTHGMVCMHGRGPHSATPDLACL